MHSEFIHIALAGDTVLGCLAANALRLGAPGLLPIVGASILVAVRSARRVSLSVVVGGVRRPLRAVGVLRVALLIVRRVTIGVLLATDYHRLAFKNVVIARPAMARHL
jgi:hypothetical protein